MRPLFLQQARKGKYQPFIHAGGIVLQVSH
jgi:hypothetical protein